MYDERSEGRSGRSASPEPYAPSQAGNSASGRERGPQIFSLNDPSLYNIPQKQESTKSLLSTSNSTPSKSLLRDPENHEFIVKDRIKFASFFRYRFSTRGVYMREWMAYIRKTGPDYFLYALKSKIMGWCIDISSCSSL